MKPVDYESHIEKIETALADSQQQIADMANIIEDQQESVSERDTMLVNMAFQYIETCHAAMAGRTVCHNGCEIHGRDLRPAEESALDAAVDMLSRAFDGGWQRAGCGTGQPPECEQSE